jgi:rare lipoprotein A
LLVPAVIAAVVLLGSRRANAETGVASVYSGGMTASDARANPHDLTAAHKTLPLGSRVRVTNQGNGRSVVVVINDRRPSVPGRIIDVMPAVAARLGFSGLARVT